ncbi:MAG: peptidoglycan DD-metalloendopeptidase family protein [Candidatus Diapherotrites archaeon]
MDSVMRLLVVAIAAAALIAVIYLMFVVPADDPGQLIKKQLETAQVELGKIQQIQILEYTENYAMQGELFDDRGRSVAFECNNENLCCIKGEKCGEIEWDERLIAFKKKRPVETISRCFLEEGIFVCRVYFGKGPAQVEITEVVTEDTLDLSQRTAFPVSVKIKNSGNSIMTYGSIEMKLYQWQTQFENSKLIFITQESQPLTVMNPGNEFTRDFTFNPETSGEYEIHIRAEGENAGFWEKTIEFNVTGIPASDCSTIDDEGEIVCDPQTNKIKEKYYCDKCEFGFECEKLWEAQTGLTLETGDKSFTYYLTNDDCPDPNAEPDFIIPSGSAGQLAWPTPGITRVGSCFGNRMLSGRPDWHDGIDISAPSGTPVFTMAPGIVFRIGTGYNAGFGNSIVIKHSDTLFTAYNHLRDGGILVSPGETVVAGQQIGVSGNTGLSTGAHLDIKVYTSADKVWRGDTGVNPLCYFPASITSGLDLAGASCQTHSPYDGCSS